MTTFTGPRAPRAAGGRRVSPTASAAPAPSGQGLTLEQEAPRAPRISVQLPHCPADSIPGGTAGVGGRPAGGSTPTRVRPQLGWAQGVLTGTHSFRKVLTAMAEPRGATCRVVASARWPCCCR